MWSLSKGQDLSIAPNVAPVIFCCVWRTLLNRFCVLQEKAFLPARHCLRKNVKSALQEKQIYSHSFGSKGSRHELKDILLSISDARIAAREREPVHRLLHRPTPSVSRHGALHEEESRGEQFCSLVLQCLLDIIRPHVGWNSCHQMTVYNSTGICSEQLGCRFITASEAKQEALSQK